MFLARLIDPDVLAQNSIVKVRCPENSADTLTSRIPIPNNGSKRRFVVSLFGFVACAFDAMRFVRSKWFLCFHSVVPFLLVPAELHPTTIFRHL